MREILRAIMGPLTTLLGALLIGVGFISFNVAPAALEASQKCGHRRK